MYVCMYILMNVCMYVCMYCIYPLFSESCIHFCVYKYIRMSYMCMFPLYMYVCMYVVPQLNGVILAGRGQSLDLHSSISHLAPAARSEQSQRNVVGEGAWSLSFFSTAELFIEIYILYILYIHTYMHISMHIYIHSYYISFIADKGIFVPDDA